MAVRSGTLGDSMPWALATEGATNASAATSRKFNRVRGLRVMRASGLGGAKQVVLPRNWRKTAKEQQRASRMIEGTGGDRVAPWLERAGSQLPPSARKGGGQLLPGAAIGGRARDYQSWGRGRVGRVSMIRGRAMKGED